MIMDTTNSISATRAPRRAKQIIDGLLANKTITPTGLNYVVNALDPFHDTHIRLDGYPDMSATNSITQTVQKTFTLTSSLGTGVLWDAHVFFLPLTAPFTLAEPDFLGVDGKREKKLEKKLSKKDVKKDPLGRIMQKRDAATIGDPLFHRTTMNSTGGMVQSGGGINLCAGVNMICIPAGEDWLSPTAGNNNYELALPPEYCSGQMRVIGNAIEIVNTTDTLHKGGSLTTYRSPSPACTFNGYITTPQPGGVGNQFFPFTLGTVAMPPTNQPDAQLYPNSLTWGADKGIYQVGMLNNIENDYITPLPGAAGLLTPSNFTNLSEAVGWAGYFPLLLDPVSGGEVVTQSLVRTIPYDTYGCVLAGLSAETSLQVTVKYFFERAPTIADPDLLVLAGPSPDFDPTALDIMSRAMGRLPVAVEQGENPLGEWFAEVMQAVGEFAPVIGGALQTAGIPFAGPIGNLLGQAGRGVHGLMKKQVVIEKGKGKRKKKEIVTTITTPNRRGPRKPMGPTRRTMVTGRLRGDRARIGPLPTNTRSNNPQNGRRRRRRSA